MDNGIVEITLALISLLGLIITTVLVPYIRSKTTEKQRENTYRLVEIAVSSAEQLLKIEDPSGKKRKQYVITYLEKKGIKIEIEDLEVMIEGAVHELNLIQKSLLE